MASSYVDGGASSSGLEEVWVPPWKGELGSLSVQGWVVTGGEDSGALHFYLSGRVVSSAYSGV